MYASQEASRLRVALVTPMLFGAGAYIGGGERYPLNLARGLVAADADVHVKLIGVAPEPRSMSLQPRLEVHALAPAVAGAEPLDHVGASLGSLLETVDLVHVHQAYTRASQVAILAAKVLGKRVVVTDHGALTNHIERTVGYLSLVDLFVFQSRFAATRVRSGIPGVIAPGGVDPRFFRPAADPPRREHVLFAGRLLPHKGVDRLLSALPEDVPCVLVGRAYDATHARFLEALAARRQVTFVHDADDLVLRDLYRRAWVTVLPSVHRDAWGTIYEAPELMGLTALEAMACGTPAIVTRAGALPEFVDDGQTGFVVSGLEELAGRIRQLVSGEVSPDRLGRAAREAAEQRYSLEALGRRVHGAYKDLMSEAVTCVF